jgi:hypothetical protein
MTEQQPQPFTPYAAGAPQPRPNALWFVVGAVLMVLGIVIGVVVIVVAVRNATVEDGVITANGQAAAVASPANQKRMLFVESGHTPPNCSLVDGSGQALLKRAILDDVTVTTHGQEWRAFAQIDSSGDGALTITCAPVTGDVAQVRVGQPVDVASLGGTVLAGVGALGLLGGSGFVVLLVTSILWFTRKPVPPPYQA